MKAQITRWITAGFLALAATTMLLPDAQAACGCDKPPPPRATVRPFVGHPDQQITLFDDRLVQNARYTVLFESRDGRQDWSRGKAASKRDFADGQYRMQLRVEVGDVSMGPVAISVYDDTNKLVYGLPDDQFTVIAQPIAQLPNHQTTQSPNWPITQRVSSCAPDRRSRRSSSCSPGCW